MVIRALGLCFLMLHVATSAGAQTYPHKSVRYIVSGSAGSGADTLGRYVGDGLTQVFGKPVIVENRPGAGSNIAAELAAKAPPDGYTVFQATITHAVNVTLYRSLSYSLARDFAPVTQLATGPAVLVVHPSLPVKSVPELVKLAKARPGAINYASGGTGTFTFLAAELFKGQTGVNMLHVPYRGGGAALNAVMSGEAPVYFAPVATALPNMREGRLRALAVTTAKRVTLVPELPTIAESGLPNYESGNWYGVLVPVKTPPETIAAIRAGVVAALNNPAVGRRLIDSGYVTIGSQPEEFGAFIRSEVERLGKIIRAFNLSAD